MNPKSWKRLYAVGALAFAGAFVLLAGQRPAAGQDNNGEGRKLPGTWNVTLRFPECTTLCPCPGGVPDIPIPPLQTYSQDGSMLESLDLCPKNLSHYRGSCQELGVVRCFEIIRRSIDE